jgi:hypothetical protein
VGPFNLKIIITKKINRIFITAVSDFAIFKKKKDKEERKKKERKKRRNLEMAS